MVTWSCTYTPQFSSSRRACATNVVALGWCVDITSGSQVVSSLRQSDKCRLTSVS